MDSELTDNYGLTAAEWADQTQEKKCAKILRENSKRHATLAVSCSRLCATQSNYHGSGSVMIAQRKNGCISLSVLSMAQVMIAQWENGCISLSVLSVAPVMIAQWKNECISLSVLSMARVMIAQWKNECISLSVLPLAWVMIAQWEN